MTSNPKPRVDIVCAECGNAVMRFYLRDDRLTYDSRHEATRFGLVDGKPAAAREHQQWFRGVDVADDLNGVSDHTMRLECRCRVRDVSLAQTADRVRSGWPTNDRGVARLTL